MLGTEFDLADLERASAAYEQQVSEAVSADEETEAYVHELETRRDALGDELDVPSGESLAAELTRRLQPRVAGVPPGLSSDQFLELLSAAKAARE